MKISRLFLFTTAVFLAACATKPVVEVRTFKIAGGQAVDLPMTKDGPEQVETDDVRIEATGFMLDDENRELIYLFGFTEKKRAVPRSVTVEDVTGDRAEILVVDTMPQLDANGYWKGLAMPRRKGDSTLGWVTDTGDTYKVFRFHIMMADGRPYIIHQASIWPNREKALIRTVLGYEVSPAAP